MRNRIHREAVTRFAHPGAGRGNYANHVFHLRQAGQLATGIMAHLAGAERDRPGCTGEAIEHLKALMDQLYRSTPPSLEFKRDDVRGDETNQET